MLIPLPEGAVGGRGPSPSPSPHPPLTLPQRGRGSYTNLRCVFHLASAPLEVFWGLRLSFRSSPLLPLFGSGCSLLRVGGKPVEMVGVMTRIDITAQRNAIWQDPPAVWGLCVSECRPLTAKGMGEGWGAFVVSAGVDPLHYNDVQPHLSLSMMSPGQFADHLLHLR